MSEEQRLSALDAQHATAWRLLRRIYLRLLARDLGRDPGTLTEAEGSALIDPHLRAFGADFAALQELIEVARDDGYGRLLRAMHRAEGVDHEMLDEAVEYATAEIAGERAAVR